MSLFGKFFKRPAPRDRIARETIDLSPLGVQGNVSYHNIDFVDCDFIMSDRWPQFLTDCTFQSCRFTLEKSLRGFRTTDAKFTNCDFHFKHASNWQAHNGERFEDCRFTGHLTGSRFGQFKHKDPLPNEETSAYLTNCDFSQLNIDETSFHGISILESCKFPAWPVIGYISSNKGDALPDSIKALPEAFHHKCCTSVWNIDSFYIVNLKTLNLNHSQIKSIAQQTSKILLFGD